MNKLLLTDAYKHTHWNLLPPKTQYVYSYAESRGVTDKGVPKETLFFGLQMYLKKYFEGQFYTLKDVEECDRELGLVFNTHEYFNKEGFLKMYEKYQGRLPIRIKAVPEGSVVPSRNALVTIENTDPEFPWIVNFIETLLLQVVWYPTTVASQSYGIRKLINKWAEKTGGQLNNIFALNDFGLRGVSSVESAELGGMAHLAVFKGSDNLAAIPAIRKYYNYDGFVLGSVAATEHSETIMWGKDHEIETYRHFLTMNKDGILSIVIDSWDAYHAVDEIFGKELKKEILERNGTTVFRPDSGNPPDVARYIANSLAKNFGYTTNDLGYKVLNPKVRIIYGDFIRYGMIDDILSALEEDGFSTDNIVFGMGGALLQGVNRDTFKFALKTSAVDIGGEWFEVSKSPVGDQSKKSKGGRFSVVFEENQYKTVPYNGVLENVDVLETVFENGKIVKEYNWEQVTANVNKNF